MQLITFNKFIFNSLNYLQYLFDVDAVWGENLVS